MHDVVRSVGQRFQYSVFLCDLSEMELIQLRWDLSEVMDQTIDSVAIVDLGRPDQIQRSTFQFMGPRPALPANESTVL